jgi:hypothetical protein
LVDNFRIIETNREGYLMAAKTGTTGRHSKGSPSTTRTAKREAVASPRATGNSEGAGRTATGKAKRVMKKKTRARQLELSVVGIEHRITHDTMRKMVRQLPIKCYLQREPDNMHDVNAVKVVVHPDNDFRAPNWHIGYLRRAVAEKFAPRMDAHNIEVLDCDLIEIDTETWREGTLKLILSGKAESIALET